MTMYKIPKPRFKHDESKTFHHAESKCKTCAYHTPLTEDELSFESDMRMLRPERHHACHERSNVWCAGSAEIQNRFEGAAI